MGSLTVWHWILSVVLIVVMYTIYRLPKRTSPGNISAGGPTGVGGWLLLLVVGLMFLGPLIGAARIKGEFISAEEQYPNLLTFPAWSIFKSATWWSFLVGSCLSFYAGLGLAKGRDISVVKRAKIILWIIGPVASIVMGLFIPMIVSGKVGLAPQFFGSLIASVIVAGIWTAYLSTSRRVKATYAPIHQRGSALHEPTKAQVNAPLNPADDNLFNEVPKVSAEGSSASHTRPDRTASVPAGHLAGSEPSMSRESINRVTHFENEVSVTNTDASDENELDAMYAQIWEELESGKTDIAAWSRAYAECSGDDARTRARYIELRASRLVARAVDERRRRREAAEEAARAAEEAAEAAEKAARAAEEAARNAARTAGLRERIRRGDPVEEEVGALRWKDIRALFFSIEYGIDLEEVKEQISSNPAYLAVKNDFGQTPLLVAIRERRVSLAEFMLENGANPDAVAGRGMTPRALACEMGLTQLLAKM